jgi:hypothetical protein
MLILTLQVFFSVVTGSITLGQIGPNLQAITTSRAASFSLFEIIDRVSLYLFIILFLYNI